MEDVGGDGDGDGDVDWGWRGEEAWLFHLIG